MREYSSPKHHDGVCLNCADVSFSLSLSWVLSFHFVWGGLVRLWIEQKRWMWVYVSFVWFAPCMWATGSWNDIHRLTNLGAFHIERPLVGELIGRGKNLPDVGLNFDFFFLTSAPILPKLTLLKSYIYFFLHLPRNDSSNNVSVGRLTTHWIFTDQFVQWLYSDCLAHPMWVGFLPCHLILIIW